MTRFSMKNMIHKIIVGILFCFLHTHYINHHATVVFAFTFHPQQQQQQQHQKSPAVMKSTKIRSLFNNNQKDDTDPLNHQTKISIPESSTLEITKDSSYHKAVVVLSSVLCVLLSSPILTPAVTETGTTVVVGQKGSILFESNCVGCHRGGMNFIKESKTLYKDALDRNFQLDQIKIQSFVQTKMPHKLLPFSQTFTNDDYYDVTSYVVDQAVNDKW